MRDVDDNLLTKLEGQEIKPFYLLDMKLPNGVGSYLHYRVTDRDVPITNLGKTLTEDRRFSCIFLSTSVITDAHWSMNEDPNDDTKILDRSINEYKLTKNGNAVIRERSFKNGNNSIYLFDGTKDYLSMNLLGSELGGNYTDITFSFWIKPDFNIFTRNTDHTAIIINRINSYQISLKTNNTIRITIDCDGGSDYLTSTDEVNLNEWNFVSCRYTQSTDTMSIKINDGDWISKIHTYGGNIYDETANDFYIGYEYYCGYIADVRIYKYYFLDDEIEKIKNNVESNWVRDNDDIKECSFVSVPDGDDAGWTFGSGWEYNNENMSFDCNGSSETSQLYYDELLPNINSYYNISYTINGLTGESDSYIQFSAEDGSSGTIREEDGNYSDVILAGSANDKLIIESGNYCEASITNIRIQPSIKKIAGSSISNCIQRGRISKDGLYRIKWKISNMTAGTVSVNFGGHCETIDKIIDGEYEDYLYTYGISQGREYTDITIEMSADFDGTIDWIDVKPILWITRDINDIELLDDWNFSEGDGSQSPWIWGDEWTSPSSGYQADFSNVVLWQGSPTTWQGGEVVW